MSNALSNLRFRFNHISEIRKLVETHNLYVEYMLVAPDHVSYVIPIQSAVLEGGYKAVHEGDDHLRGTDDEIEFYGGLCIVGLKSGAEFVAGQLAERVEEQINKSRQESYQTGKGGLINLNILGLASPKNG
jgi:hypothetical protein